MKLTRTYPQPDSPQPNLGARERALNTFKYLLDLEPEQATQHPRFAVMVHAFEQSERRGWNACVEVVKPCVTDDIYPKQLDASYCDLLTSTTEAVLKALPPNDPFVADGI